MIYSTEQWHFFDHFMKIMMNQLNFPNVQRSLLRNLIFNTLRCMPEEVYFYYCLGDVTPDDMIIFRLACVWLITIVVHFTVSTKAGIEHPNKWSCAMILFVTSFGIQFSRAISVCYQ